jgi:hypothetical protein
MLGSSVTTDVLNGKRFCLVPLKADEPDANQVDFAAHGCARLAVGSLVASYLVSCVEGREALVHWI